MISENIFKTLLRDYDGCNFIIKTSEPYYDSESNSTKYKEYYGHKFIKLKNETIKLYKCKILELKYGYIKLEYNDADTGCKYYKFLDLTTITSITFPPKDRYYSSSWNNSNWMENSWETKDGKFEEVMPNTITSYYANIKF